MSTISSGDIKKLLPNLINEFPEFAPESSRSKVVNYSGSEGLKQITLNTLKAKDGLRMFEIENMSAFLNYGFAEEVRNGFVTNKIQVKELTNKSTQEPWTKVQAFVDKFWQCRYIDPQILKMDTELAIYNDCTAIYNYKNDQIFCVEIYNQNLANMHKQIFDFMWHYGKKLK